MSDNGKTLTVDPQGFVCYKGARLPVRHECGTLEFIVKRPADRARLKCKRVKIPLGDFKQLERTAAPERPRPAGKMPRDHRREIVTRRNCSVDKTS